MAKARKPNFLIAGVQKAGTTFLADHLAEHPDVFFAEPKELFFFNEKRLTRADFVLYRFENFHAAGDQRLVGEGSTNYFHHAQAIDHIERFLGHNIHVIVCLRHPVERLFSHYLHDYKRKRRTGSEALDDQIWSGYFSRSLYAERLTLWRERFRHFMPMFFDDLVASGADFYNQAAQFLELEPQHVDDRHVNEGLRMMWDGDVLTISSPPGPDQVAPRFRRDTVEALVRRFTPDVEATAAITGRNLTPWRTMPDFGQIGSKFAVRA